MPLTPDQEGAVNNIFQFLMSDDKEYIISGPAGTGKTYLMKHIMNTVLTEYEDACTLLGLPHIPYEIALTATTNKATEVLSQSTGFFAVTIHSFLHLKVTDNYKTGISEVVPTADWRVYKNTLIFIDEASMIDSKLYSYIHKATDHTCKIIYLGDHCQMAPVFETLSPVYKTPKYFSRLETPMRNASQPALMSLCSSLRNTVETLDFFKIQEVPGVIDYVDDAAAKQFIDSTFKQEHTDARILCFTNARVHEYNQYIRELRNYPQLFIEGEELISNSAVTVGPLHLRVEQEVYVNEASPQTSLIQIDPSDPDVLLEVQDITLLRGVHNIKTVIPVDRGHYKALLNYYARQKNWHIYYKLKNGFPDLRQKDAATVYKAQGSTYHTVFLDLENIGKCNQPDQVARMLYVGASRATDRIVLYGQLPKRYQEPMGSKTNLASLTAV